MVKANGVPGKKKSASKSAKVAKRPARGANPETAVTTAWRFFNRDADAPDGQLQSCADRSPWDAPKAGKPGAWRTFDGPLVICHTGLHAAKTVYAALRHRVGDTFARVEVKGIADEVEGGKIVCRAVRVCEVYESWHVVALATLACIEPIANYERWKPGDGVLRGVVTALIDWLRGAPVDLSAAESAAWSAAAAESAAAAARSGAWSAAARSGAIERFNAKAVILLEAGNREYVAQYLEAQLAALPALGEAVAK